MSAPDRRGFLRGLASLPLIGGSVALIGQPTAAAVPATPELSERYIAWLANEHAAALFERNAEDYRRVYADHARAGWHEMRAQMPMYWFPPAPDVDRYALATMPSTRAAVILSAAGVPLVGGSA